jgi:hypothetical protein
VGPASRLPLSPLPFPMPSPPSRSGFFLLPLVLALPFTVQGCGEEPTSLQVGPVGFPESELLGLGSAQREQLALITVMGLAVADGEELALGGPILERRRALRMADRLREEFLLEAAGVSEAELEERYLTDPDHELVVRHLVVLSERFRTDVERERARARASAALGRIEDGEPFETVVAEVSEEPGAARREGLLQPGREGTWVPEFWEAAMALAEGEVSPVVETEYGFHVLRLEERRILPFEEARDRVVGEVARFLGGGEVWEAWLQERRGEVAVEDEAVRAFDPRNPDAAPPLASWPGGTLDATAAARRLRSLPYREWNDFLHGDGDVRGDRIRELALLAMQEQEAQARDLRLRPTTEGDLEREWERKVAEWGVFLGFRAGMTPAAVRDAALDGLRATGQNAQIARGELREWAPTLEVWVPIRHIEGN